ncbi:MAG: tRNA-dihydrouridine synthase family protein [Deltaproteobacteria bacterium]|nr:tRNA-dihydrouridine synthase family protein [Deltaproteobacteria bacterium]
MTVKIFESLGLPSEPVFLAPLAGVSDAPFRRICTRGGADLSYVEMISAPALKYNSKKTLQMLFRHPEEKKLGVQVTAKCTEDMKRAVEILNRYPFETVDINMGCPVRKVVGTGCGAALLRDPEQAYQITKAAVETSARPVSVKIRLGWDRQSMNYLEIAPAIENAGAVWLTVHGRTRSDDYSREVDLQALAEIKRAIRIPVVGNGNIFSRQDYLTMKAVSGVDGVMISRGSLGNPWVFREVRGDESPTALEEWRAWVGDHLKWQQEHYSREETGVIMLRKQLLWYMTGWPLAKIYKERFSHVKTFQEVFAALDEFCSSLTSRAVVHRRLAHPLRHVEESTNP